MQSIKIKSRNFRKLQNFREQFILNSFAYNKIFLFHYPTHHSQNKKRRHFISFITTQHHNRQYKYLMHMIFKSRVMKYYKTKPLFKTVKRHVYGQGKIETSLVSRLIFPQFKTVWYYINFCIQLISQIINQCFFYCHF